MIPKRIKLSGFLCYREEQEVAFDGSSLWMLSGLNGSGKSSIFDAVTYALFGHHRGGSQGASELINKAENGFAIEFDFLLDGEQYRIKRTLKRRSSGTAATQQVLKWHQATGDWEPVADTQRKIEFDNWIREHIGLNYETFTSSVLLLQGRAEKLLDSTAKGRAELLASIVDLQRYQRLHEKADGLRKALKGQAEAVEDQINAIPDVTEMELLAVQNRIEDAEEALTAAQNEVERLQGLEYLSKQYIELKQKLGAAQQRKAQSARLIQEADEIEKNLRRLKELRDALPHVEVIFQRRADLTRSEERTKQLSEQMRELERKQADLDHRLEQIKLRRSNVQRNIAADEDKANANAKKLLDLSAALERVNLIEQRTEELKQLEADLKKFPPDLTTQLNDAQTRIEELTGIERALSPLQRFAEARRDLAEALERVRSAQQAEASIKARGEELRRRYDELKPRVETARVALKQAEDKLASERALLKQAEALRAELDSLDGAKKCRTCGSPLTEKHLREEKSARDDAIKSHRDRLAQAQIDLTTARTSEQQLTAEQVETEHLLQAARDEYRDANAALTLAQKDVARLEKECKRTYTELTDSFRQRIAPAVPSDWTTTTFPTCAELDELRQAVVALPGERRKLEHTRNAINRSNSLQGQIKAARQVLEDLTATITGDPQAIRRDYARLDAESKALAAQLKAARDEERATSSEAEKIGEELGNVRELISQREGAIRTEEASRKFCHQAIATARKSLSPEWQERADRVALADMNRLRGERDDLERSGVEKRAEELRAARIEVESLRQQLADLERECEQFPVEARVDPSDIQQRLSAARLIQTEKAEALNAARNERTNLENRASRRRELQDRLASIEREWRRYKILAELLGRDRLQRHLVRQAERQIVDYANGVLDRLSGGTLMLRLVGGEDGAPADQALELEAYNRATGQAPINVAFLSGSQRFRVAVSLALGIGQYASRLHRPIESVIIDEGFGCLDRQGRQVMIQELQNLRGHLQCILLVSHQEEFAEAFADGYRFELADGATKVTRLQR